MPDQWEKARALFLRASGCAPEEQTALIRGIDDPSLRREVESLVAAGARAAGIGFLDPPSSALGFPARRADDSQALDRLIGRRIGAFTILRLLGVGGMGVVYEAEQDSPRRTVALKLTRGAVRGAGGSDTLRREARALARLNHPGIASVYHAGKTEEGDHYFAMELVRGTSLTDFVRRGQLSIHQRLELFCQVCDAVHYAHMRSIIHRDLKPSNIMVDESGRPRILDFGLARITDTDVAQTTVITDAAGLRGTLAYMSPEQARGRADEIDLRSDVYSLGVVLYEILVDRCPLDLSNVSLPEALRIICEQSPSAPSTAIRALSSDLDAITLKALSKDPDRRYQSADALAEDIRRHLDKQPIHARRPTAVYQIKKLIQRHRGMFSLACASLVVLCAVTVYAFSQAAWARNQRDLAEERRAELERVAEFQASMLRAAAPERMGRFLMQDLRTRVEATLERENAGSTRREEVLESLDEVLARVNLTDTAAALVGTELLGEAGRTVERDFADRPLTEAMLRLNIGQAYYALGLYGRAATELESVVEVRSDRLGATAEATLEAVHALGVVLQAQGHFDLAGQHLSTCLEGRHALLGETHPDTLAARADLANVLRELGDGKHAVEEHRRILEIRERTLGPMHKATLDSLIQLGWSLKAIDEFEEAEHCFREAVARTTSGPRERVAPSLAALNGLAMVLEARGRLDDCREVLVELVERMRHVYGSDHPETLKTLTNLGRAFEMVGRGDEAVVLLEEAYDGGCKALGAGHPETLRALARLAQNTGESPESEVLWRRTYEGYRSLYGSEHRSVYGALRMLATKIAAQGRIDEALPLCREARGGLRRLLGPDHSDTLAATNDLGFILARAERYAEAEPVFRDALKAFRHKFGQAHVATASAALNVGLTLSELGRPREALPFLQEAVAGFRATRGPANQQTMIAVWELLNVYVALGELDVARLILDEAAQSLETATTTDDQLATAYEDLAGSYAHLYTASADPADAEQERAWCEEAAAIRAGS